MTYRSLQTRVVGLDNARYHGPRRSPHDIRYIVMHCTAGESAHSSITWMNREQSDNPVSYHYLIDRDGTIYRHCPPETIAYHAGDSAFPADPSKAKQGSSLNRSSLGIAWANRNDGERLTPAQIESAQWLCAIFMDSEQIPVEHVIGHYECSPHRKTDPKPCMEMGEWRNRLRTYLTEKHAA